MSISLLSLVCDFTNSWPVGTIAVLTTNMSIIFNFLSYGTRTDSYDSVILHAVEDYIRNTAEDVRDMKAVVNENGKRL